MLNPTGGRLGAIDPRGDAGILISLNGLKKTLAPVVAISALLFVACEPFAGLASPEPSTWRWTGVSRIVAVPDVHGAYPELVSLLQATGLIDQSLAWSGGSTHLVSLGDLLDRGPQSRATMDLLMRLQDEAASAGGRVHVVLGNHEHMNLIGDLRYVSDAEYAAFADEEPPGARERARAAFAADPPEQEDTVLDQAFVERYPPGYFGHRAAFRPDGRYGKWLLTLPTLIVINDTAFVHGGLPEITSTLDPARMNLDFSRDIARYLEVWRALVEAGVLPDDEPDGVRDLGKSLLEDPARCVQERALACEKIEADAAIRDRLAEFGRLSGAPVHSYDAPFWYRGSVFCRDILEDPILDRYLANLGAKRVVVGHTPTPDAAVHSIRNGKVIMADTGMLVSYYHGRPAALLIEDGKIEVQYLRPDERKPPAVGFPDAYGLDEAALAKALHEAEIAAVDKPEGAPYWRVTLKHADRALTARFYPENRSGAAAHELAAAALDDLLGFELIAPTVSRKIDGTGGALQLAYPDAVSEAERLAQSLGFDGWCPMTQQFHLMYAFDLLTANSGRQADNVLYRRGNWVLTLTGHAGTFGRSDLPRGLPDDLLTLPPGVAASLSRLNEAELKAALGEWVNDRALRALLERRDALLKGYGAGVD